MSLQAPTSVNVVSVDGRWTDLKEWDDAMETTMFVGQGSGSAYIRVKHDSSNLYFLFDFVTDVTPAREQPAGTSDFAYFRVDADDNLVWDKNVDFTVRIRWDGQSANYVVGVGVAGIGANISFSGAMSYTGTNRSQSAHAVYEFAIPKSTLHNSTMVGIRANLQDGMRGVLTWPEPPPYDSWDLKYFGDIVFSDIVIPEFNIAMISVIFGASLLAALVLIKRKMALK